MTIDERTASLRLESAGHARGRRTRRAASLLLALAALAGGAGPALARDPASLLDLRVPASRVPDWVEPPGVPVDTSNWTVVPVHAVDCADNATSDRAPLFAAIGSAPARSVILLDGGGCVYNIEVDLPIMRSDLVIRGDGMDRTSVVLRGQAQLFVVTGGGLSGARSWTGGFAAGTRTLTLASTSGLAVGDFVRMSANLPAGAEARQGNHTFLAKVAGVSGSQLTLDLPLPIAFDTGGQGVEEFSPMRHVGIEDMTVAHEDPSADMAYRYLVLMRGVAESWITGVRFRGVWSHAAALINTTRMVVRGNVFADQQKPDPWNKAALKFAWDASTNLVEKNAFLGAEVAIELEYGSVHNVIAYNYVAPPDGACERGIFIHNDYAAANLFEGNDLACPAQWDDFWGSSGPLNTFFRNRLRSGATMIHGQHEGRMGGEYLNGREHLSYNLLANHVKDLAGGPQADQAVDSYGRDFWIERNVYRSECTLAQSSGAVAPECASRPPPYAVNTTWDTNHLGNAAPAAWAGFRVPASLYRSTPPAWWCPESGTFPNVGAPTDDASGGPAAYPKLPAQRLAEGLGCGSAGVPAAPVLLDD